jgi:AraC-like DNA-binding protein
MQPHSVPTGILTPAGLGATFTLERFAPSADLGYFVLRYWTVVWDVVGPVPYAQQTLPYPCVNLVVEQIASDRTITRVAQVAERIGLSQRTLQRLFSQYVGVSPKWVIRRYRLLEAADHLAHHADADLPDLAQTLGYFDQAHFINDFRATIGSTPTEYVQRQKVAAAR